MNALVYMLCFYGDLEQFIIILLLYDVYGVQHFSYSLLILSSLILSFLTVCTAV